MVYILWLASDTVAVSGHAYLHRTLGMRRSSSSHGNLSTFLLFCLERILQLKGTIAAFYPASKQIKFQGLERQDDLLNLVTHKVHYRKENNLHFQLKDPFTTQFLTHVLLLKKHTCCLHYMVDFYSPLTGDLGYYLMV